MLWSNAIRMSLLLGFCLVSGQVSAKQTPEQLKARCDTKKEARPCFETGYTELAKGTPESRKVAQQYFRKACAYSKKKNRCTDNEVKTTARSHRWTGDRLPANVLKSAKKKVSDGRLRIIAPKVPKSTSRGPTNYAQPAQYNRPEVSAPAFNNSAVGNSVLGGASLNGGAPGETPPGTFEPSPPPQDPNMMMSQQTGEIALPPQGSTSFASPEAEDVCTPDNPSCVSK